MVARGAMHVSNPDPVTIVTAVQRGLMGKCPRCGQGRLFDGFLRVSRQCEVCGEPFHHHRADDLPAYLVLLFVGHLIVTLLLIVDSAYAPPYWVEFAIWIPLTLVLSLGLAAAGEGSRRGDAVANGHARLRQGQGRAGTSFETRRGGRAALRTRGGRHASGPGLTRSSPRAGAIPGRARLSSAKRLMTRRACVGGA